jgi:hypothetical protein
VLTGGIVSINNSGPSLGGFLQGLFAFLRGLFGGGGTGNNGGGSACGIARPGATASLRIVRVRPDQLTIPHRV